MSGAKNKFVSKKKRLNRNVPVGVASILASFNNTIITFSDLDGEVVSWASAGSKGFKGFRRGTPFAAQLAAEDAVKKAIEWGLKTCSIRVRGPGSGRESAMRAIAGLLKVTSIMELTASPHNGCRPPKRRRV